MDSLWGIHFLFAVCEQLINSTSTERIKNKTKSNLILLKKNVFSLIFAEWEQAFGAETSWQTAAEHILYVSTPRWLTLVVIDRHGDAGEGVTASSQRSARVREQWTTRCMISAESPAGFLNYGKSVWIYARVVFSLTTSCSNAVLARVSVFFNDRRMMCVTEQSAWWEADVTTNDA